MAIHGNAVGRVLIVSKKHSFKHVRKKATQRKGLLQSVASFWKGNFVHAGDAAGARALVPAQFPMRTGTRIFWKKHQICLRCPTAAQALRTPVTCRTAWSRAQLNVADIPF